MAKKKTAKKPARKAAPKSRRPAKPPAKKAARKPAKRSKPAARPKAPAKPAAIPAAKAVPEIGSDAVKSATGKSWDEWYSLLDADRAQQMEHKDIALLLRNKYGVGDWWCQMVTVGYERARGIRVKHQTASGFSISASRTMPVSVERAFRAWYDPAQRALWLPEMITIRKATEYKGLRITWSDGKTCVEVNLWPKGENKTQVVAQHSKLPDLAAGEKMKAYWAERLGELERMLVGM